MTRSPSPPSGEPAPRPRKLFLFTKPAVAGRVKTRLIGELTGEQTAELHGAFLSDVCEVSAEGAFEPLIAWALEPGETIPSGVGRLRLSGLRQDGHDLGDRLFRQLSAGSRTGAHVAALGSDHPEVRHETLNEAFDLLDDGTDVVIGPTPDGGYFLIALAAASVRRRIFEDIAWSTESVRQQTLDRCAELGLRVVLLPLGHDVDIPPDLDALVARLGERFGGCPATRRLLQQWGRLAEVEP